MKSFNLTFFKEPRDGWGKGRRGEEMEERKKKKFSCFHFSENLMQIFCLKNSFNHSKIKRSKNFFLSTLKYITDNGLMFNPLNFQQM